MKYFTIWLALFIFYSTFIFSQSQPAGCMVNATFHGNYVTYLPHATGGPLDIIYILPGDSFYFSLSSFSVCTVIDFFGPNNYQFSANYFGQTPYLKDTGFYTAQASPSFYGFWVKYSTQTTSIYENFRPGFLIYPNPVQATVHLVFDQPLPNDMECFVYNSIGKQLLRNTIDRGKKETDIDAQFLNAGSYIVELTDPSGRLKHFSRFVKL